MEWIEMDGKKKWKWLKGMEMAVNSWSDRKLLAMAGNRWKWLEMGGSGWKWVEVAGNSQNGSKWLKELKWVEMDGNGSKLLEITIMA